MIDHIGAARTEYEHPAFDLKYRAGSRRLQRADIALGPDASLRIEPTGQHFYMSGLGYTHPTWGHGRDHGEFETAYDVVGPICETGDTFTRNRALPALAPGDLVAFMTALTDDAARDLHHLIPATVPSGLPVDH